MTDLLISTFCELPVRKHTVDILRKRSDIFVRDVKVLNFQMIQLSTTLSLSLK